MRKLVLLALVGVVSVFGMSSIEIINKVNARDDGQQVSRKLKMVLVDKHGKKRIRETKSYRKYYGEDKKSIIFYTAPKRVAKTAFLTYDYKDKEDQQWLYLPAIKKVRRISASDRGDWFLGTDFSYEDIKKETKISTDDYNFALDGEENVDGHRCYKIVGTTKNKDIADELGYSKVISFIDQDIFIARKAIFYDTRGELLKVLHSQDIKQIDGIWTITHMHMENKQNGHTSDFYFTDIDYKTPLKDKLFTKQALKRGK